MDISTSQYKRCDVVKAAGRIDGSTAPQLEEAMKSVMDAGRYKIILDMSDINFMSSAGWWVLIRTQKNCKRFNRGELVLACIDDKIRSSLDLVGMGHYFRIFDNVTSAVGNF